MTQDKETNTSGVAEPKDAQEAAAEEGKTSDESTSQTDKETKEGDGDVKSEECSSGSKVEGTDKEQKREARNPEDVEKVFASKTQERLLGLLGAVLPQDSKVQLTSPTCIQLSLEMFCRFGLWSYTIPYHIPVIPRQETTHSSEA